MNIGLHGLKMQADCEAPRVLAIVGPTAVGKTEVSLQLAEALNGEIVSTDSRQFYRGMDIGTAKAAAGELARVPHHLIDVADPDEIWSLAVFPEGSEAGDQRHQQPGQAAYFGGRELDSIYVLYWRGGTFLHRLPFHSCAMRWKHGRVKLGQRLCMRS